MSEWIYFGHPPRDGFVETITDEESAIMQTHRAQVDAGDAPVGTRLN